MVAQILADMQMDLVCLRDRPAARRRRRHHDHVEEIRKAFGDDVARCVDGVTKLSKLNLHNREDRQAESVRKMLLAMVEDIRVIIVKLADRLHNMRTLGSLSRERQERIAAETIEIYAPIAHRLGMGKVRGELEDLAFRYLDPEAYHEVDEAIEIEAPGQRAGARRDPRHRRTRSCADEGIPARVQARVKRP